MLDTLATTRLDAARLNESKNTLNTTQKKLKEQTDGFEAIILKLLLDEAMPTASNPLFPKGPGDEIYKSMYTDALSRNITGSFGFSQLLFDYLSQNPTISKEAK